jgi:hypothetical protein
MLSHGFKQFRSGCFEMVDNAPNGFVKENSGVSLPISLQFQDAGSFFKAEF